LLTDWRYGALSQQGATHMETVIVVYTVVVALVVGGGMWFTRGMKL
jgi:membrane protein DedA with SNARE-associated domain